MSKFKVGDRITVRPDLIEGYCGGDSVVKAMLRLRGKRVTIKSVFGNGKYHIKEDSWNWTDEMFEGTAARGDTTVARRTFKLIKGTAELKPGALVQEKCDDGDQDYTILDHAFVKYENERGGKGYTFPRGAVEQEPSWFVEVFAVTPQFMTREELDRWEAFQKVEAKPARKRRAKKITTVKATRASKAKAA